MAGNSLNLLLDIGAVPLAVIDASLLKNPASVLVHCKTTALQLLADRLGQRVKLVPKRVKRLPYVLVGPKFAFLKGKIGPCVMVQTLSR